MQFIISDDQFYASGVSNLARLQNGQTRSKIGPNSGPIWQMMTTQPSAHQVVLHMMRKSEGNLFTAMEILQLFAFWQNVITHTWFMSQIKWRNAKCFQKSTFEKIPTGTYPLTKHPIGQDNRTMWNTPRVREASWLLRDPQLWHLKQNYNPFPGRILLRTRPTLCANETFPHDIFNCANNDCRTGSHIYIGVHFLEKR